MPKCRDNRLKRKVRRRRELNRLAHERFKRCKIIKLANGAGKSKHFSDPTYYAEPFSGIESVVGLYEGIEANISNRGIILSGKVTEMPLEYAQDKGDKNE